MTISERFDDGGRDGAFTYVSQAVPFTGGRQSMHKGRRARRNRPYFAGNPYRAELFDRSAGRGRSGQIPVWQLCRWWRTYANTRRGEISPINPSQF